MPEEAAFLAAIRAEPEDEAPRLIYADWLDERGDPRAEYLRVEYAVRVKGAKAQQRLQELRSELDAEWLRAVHDGKLGHDWAIVLHAYSPAHQSKVIESVCQEAGLSEAQAEVVVQGGSREIKRGLRLWAAHRLREGFGEWAYVTVEYRPRIQRRDRVSRLVSFVFGPTQEVSE
jgi:uncharacterized protein (TIGR02996 family)